MPQRPTLLHDVLGEAMVGDVNLFARQDYVEEAWRIVDPVLRADTPIFEYEKGAWGPSEVEQRVSVPEAGITRSHQIRKISA
ncbi:MAG: hypothetical protein WBX22_24825 [Silvibacterium sp.]